MLVKYDKLEDYVKKLKTLSKETEAYLSIAKDISETGIVTPSIIIQVLDKEKCFTHFYSDLPSFQVIPDSTFANIPSGEVSKENYKVLHEQFEHKINEEYKKFLVLLKDTVGFSNVIENATIIQ